ncbi:hypothetical protein [Nocardia sp. NPDC003963]
MTRLHLPHPHIADQFVEVFSHALHRGLTTDDLTTPAAQESWAQWDPDRWMAEHGRKEKTDA